MLQSLYQWRAQCTPQQLSAFETALAPLGKNAIRYQTIHQRYHGSYHCALINQHWLLAAIQTSFEDIYAWEHKSDSGEQCVRGLAAQNGIAPLPSSSEHANAALCMLKERGIVFEYDGQVCLPAEFVLMLKQNKDPQGWVSLCAKLPNAILQHLVPDDMKYVGIEMPTHNEMAAWLICKGVDAQKQIPRWQGLDETDESFLFYLDIHGSIETVKILKQFCHDAIEAKQLHERQTVSYQFSRTPLKSALQSSLEEHVPTRLKKLCHMGLVGVMVSNHNDASAKIILSEDGKQYLAPLLPMIRERMTDKLKDSWFAPAYSMEWLSPWRRDHDLWRIWVTLHFMPLRRTQRDEWRKNDMKKIMKCLHFQPDGFLERGFLSLRESNFLTETITGLLPAKICWSAWRKSQRKAILSTWNSKRREENKVADLLYQIPVEQWLNMDKVITWLKATSKNTLPDFPWDRFFFRSSVKDLIRFNKGKDCIYLPPMFRAVLADKEFAFPSPGWKGAGSSAAHAGFITAAGDIQLPPEFSHQTLKKMASFCTLTKVEHMIELRLNTEAIDPIDPNQKALAECISILESIQSPLPQAVAYELDNLP